MKTGKWNLLNKPRNFNSGSRVPVPIDPLSVAAIFSAGAGDFQDEQNENVKMEFIQLAEKITIVGHGCLSPLTHFDFPGADFGLFFGRRQGGVGKHSVGEEFNKWDSTQGCGYCGLKQTSV